jgi:hypothetical protein
MSPLETYLQYNMFPVETCCVEHVSGGNISSRAVSEEVCVCVCVMVFQEATKRGDTIRREGRNFRFHQLNNVLPKAPAAKSFSWWKWGVIFALAAFTVIFILSYLVILCDS